MPLEDLEERVIPYQGLMPYSEKDAPYFFGRENWVETITDNLMASRLSVLHGASGVGKSSVLQAGVAYQLHQLMKQNFKESGIPGFAVIIFRTWKDDPLIGLKNKVETDIKSLFDERKTFEVVPESHNLGQFLQVWAKCLGEEDQPGELFIILDQFEEYFLYHPNEKGEDTFAIQFPQVVNKTDLNVNFLISIREESIAKLDYFKSSIPPYLLNNRLCIQHLDWNSARDAIVKPIERYNLDKQTAIDIDDELINEVLKEVEAGKVIVGERGRGVVDISSKTVSEVSIETPYLQLVLVRLWDEDAKSQRLRIQTFKRLGGAKQIVQQHLKERMNSLSKGAQKTAARAFHFLVTPAGSKISLSEIEIEGYTNVNREQLSPLLEKLSSSRYRILRPVGPSFKKPDIQRYEIYHDALAPAILNWRTNYIQKQQIKRLAWIGSVIGVAAISVSIWMLMRAEQTKDVLARKTLESLEIQARQNIEDIGQLKTLELALERLFELHHTLYSRLSDEEKFRLRLFLQNILNRIREQNILSIPTGEIRGVSISDDASLLGAVSADGTVQTVRLWDLRSAPHSRKELQRIVVDQEGQLTSISLSRDGQKFVTTSSDGNARLWDLEGGEPAVLRGHEGAVLNASFSPDGQLIATASQDGTVRLWDSEGGEPIELEGGQPVVLRGHKGAVLNAIFSPDDQQIATASRDGTARLWDLEGDEPILLSEFRGHEGAVRSVSYSSYGKQIATASEDGTVRLWDSEGGKPVVLEGGQPVVLRGHKGAVLSVSYSSDDRFLTTVSNDLTVRRWSLEEGIPEEGIPSEQLARFPNTFGRILGLSSSDGRLLAVGFNRTVRLWDVQQGQLDDLLLLTERQKPYVRASFSQSTDVQLLTTVLELTQDYGTDSNNGRIDVWNFEGESKPAEFSVVTTLASPRIFSFEPSSRRLASKTDDVTVSLWDLEGSQLPLLRRDTVASALVSGSFSPDGQQFATGSENGTVCLWDLEDNLEDRKCTEPQGPEKSVLSIGFSPDSQQLATGSKDGTICLWDLEGRDLRNKECTKPQNSTEIDTSQTEAVTSLSFGPISHNKQFLATGLKNGTVCVWDLERSLRNNECTKLEGLTEAVTSLNISPDNQLLAAASGRSTARLWNVHGDLLGEFPYTKGQTILSVSFTSDSNYLATVAADGTFGRWQVGQVEDLDVLLKDGCSWLNNYLESNSNPNQELKDSCQRYDSSHSNDSSS